MDIVLFLTTVFGSGGEVDIFYSCFFPPWIISRRVMKIIITIAALTSGRVSIIMINWYYLYFLATLYSQLKTVRDFINKEYALCRVDFPYGWSFLTVWKIIYSSTAPFGKTSYFVFFVRIFPPQRPTFHEGKEDRIVR